MKRAAGASDLFTEALKTGNNAWAENSALQDEVSKRYETTESKLQLASNAMKDVKITISEGLLPSVVELSESFTNFVRDNQDGIIEFGEAVTGIFTFIINNAGTVTAGLTGIGTALAVAKLGFTTLTGPVGWVTVGITALAGVIGHLKNEAEKAAKAEEKLSRELLNAGDILQDLQQKAKGASDSFEIDSNVYSW